MKKNPLLIFILIFLTFSSLVAYGSPLGSVNTQSATIPAPLTQVVSSNGIQSKRGGLSVVKMEIGDLNASSPSIAKLTSTGKLGLAFTGSAINNNPTEALDVHGAIDIMGPAQEGTSICADSTGALAPCGFTKYIFDGKDCYYNTSTNYTCGTANMNKAYITKEFKVPVGITNITVELWGAGGAGYGFGNPNANHSPDADVNYSSTCSGATYTCIIGGSAYLLDAVNNVVIRAKGGYGAMSPHTGANGGGYTISSGSITDLGSVSGGAGGDGSSASGSTTTSTFFCGTTTHTYKIPVNGGDGGVGGKSGYGSTTPGGRGGHAGSNLNNLINKYGLTYFCTNSPLSPLNGWGYYGEDGISGSYGNGGSGAGGKGGDADEAKSIPCGTTDGDCNQASSGYSGGGGGGYVQAVVPVTPGTVYKIKLSHGGVIQNTTEDTNRRTRSFYANGIGTPGASSGNGSPSYAQISF